MKPFHEISMWIKLMIEAFLVALETITKLNDRLLLDLHHDDRQRTFLLQISTGCQALRDLLLSLVEVQTQRARDVLSFEGRSHLTTIIGYIELMLDEANAAQNANQQAILTDMHTRSHDLLRTLLDLLE